MHNEIPFDPDAPSRQLIRLLRVQPDRMAGGDALLPESVLWRVYCELRRRGERASAEENFLRSISRLLHRRILNSADLPTDDPDVEEHRLVDDPMLAELWRAYKRCICGRRTGPAAQLLRDIEAHLKAS
jgi:hypothetical protein